MEETLRKYRGIATLNDGTRVIFRPLVPGDLEPLVEMFSRVSEEDVRYLRDDIRDRRVIEKWVEKLDYTHVFPLLAVVNGRIVGEGTLHFGKGPYRHIGEVRIFLIKEFRRRGLGTAMLKKLLEIARKAGLQQVIAEVLVEQNNVIKAFQKLGFKLKFVREDYFMTPDGVTHDVAVLVNRLVAPKDVF